MKTILASILIYVTALSLVGSAGLGGQPLSVVTTTSPVGITGGGGSYVATFNADGRFVIFLSQASNLVTNDSAAPVLDLFRYDRMTGQTILVSANVTGIGGGDADSAYASVSADGRMVSFASAASNLVSGDTNNFRDLFVRDVEQGTTICVSETLPLDNMGMLEWLTSSRRGVPRFNHPLISSDGSKVVFESWATNLVLLPDTNNHNDIFIHDLAAGITSVISVNASSQAAGNSRSEQFSMTPDAGRITFLSRATDLVPGTTNTQGDIYVRDLATQTTLWASSNVVRHLPSYRCHPPTISTNGQTVVFKASAPDTANAAIFHVDLATGVTSLLHSNSPSATDAVVSGDGRTVAFDDGEQVFLWNEGTTTLLSKRFDGSAPANGNSVSPVLSLDAQIVAYASSATDIVASGVAVTNTAHQIYVLNRQTGQTRLVTQTTNGVATMASHQFAHVALSPNGAQIAFDSRAGDLVPDDLNAASDVFITPVATNDLKLISRRAESLPSLTGMRNVRIAPECLTADKQLLLFASLNKNPSSDDAARNENLFIRDLTTSAEEQITEFEIEKPKEYVFSANGQAVAYITQARATPSSETVVVFDRATGERILAHTNSLSGGLLSGPFTSLTISPDGRRIAYLNSTIGRADFAACLFDAESRSNRFVNARFSSPGQIANDGRMSAPRFSPDGTWLVFLSQSGMLTSNQSHGLFLVNLTSQSGLECIPAAYSWGETAAPAFSADSRYACASDGIFDLQARTYSQMPNTLNLPPYRYSLDANGRSIAWEMGLGGRHIAVTNRQTGITRVLNANAGFTSITPDGRHLVFASRGTNLVASDQSGMADIYLHDLTRDVTILLSSGDAGATSGNGSSTMPIVSADGRTVLFQSFADDLSLGDYNFSRDIFMVQLGGPDSDGDQMDDDWEMAYFSTLSRDDTGDFDGDGASDLAEFQAGTDPTDLGSILRIICITSLSGGHTRIVWSASPGRSYRAQYKDGFDDLVWKDLPDVVTPVGTTGSLTGASPDSNSRRFYRVVVLP